MSNKLSTDEPRFSASDQENWHQYLKEFVPGMVAYIAILLLVLVFVDEQSPWAPRLIALPVVPLLWVAVAVYRSYRRSDEYHRTVQAESMALSFGVAMIGSLVFGFLGMAEAVHPAVGPWVVFGLAMITWLTGVGVRWNR